MAKHDHWLVTTHVAESQAEFDMYMYRRGPMYEWLEPQRDMSDCGLGSPVGYLARMGLLSSHLLAVHVNYVWGDDIRLLASRGVSVAHCPRSHAYFRHQRFPMGPMLEMGVNVCLGTDSLASVVAGRNNLPTLSMQAELCALHHADPSISARQRIRFATQNPARALGLKGVVGELCTGSLADLAVIPFSGPYGAIEEATASHEGDVGGTMIGGRWEWIAPDWTHRIPLKP
jgi:cytosine/adenosine deaminase-related metal-dependent hydrolase